MYSMQIDGGVMDHPIYGFAIVNVSQDAVQEFRVLRNQFDTEYSRAGTAVVNVVTRSGTNDLHGRVLVLRPRRLAQRQERVRHAPSRRSTPTRFSAAAGGPLVRNKAFLFGTIEYNRQNSVRIIALPAANPFAGELQRRLRQRHPRQAGPGQGRLHRQPRGTRFSVRYLYDNDDIIEDYELAENTALDFSDLSASWNWTLGASMLNNAGRAVHGPGHAALPDDDRTRR